MTFNFNVPKGSASPLTFSVAAGEILFVLGANGVGKSSLIHRFFSSHAQHAQRISAHRQTWFTSNALNMTGANRREAERNLQAWHSRLDARYVEHNPELSVNVAIYDLIDAENVRAREIANAVDDDDIALAKQLALQNPPVKIINRILRSSNLPIEITIRENEQVLASKNGSEPYSVARLSDGERNALLIASTVLTAKEGALIVIDEPERHLHRSIISPLLSQLLSERPDCAFIVSTHEVMLPVDNPQSKTLLVRSCSYSGDNVEYWDADLMTPEQGIDDTLKEDILGARRKLLFVEGARTSLDIPLYSIVFPDVSIIAKDGCRDVEQAVCGIRGAETYTWVSAFGLIDNDQRPAAELQELEAKGIYPLSVYSVESIYYHPVLQRRVALKYAALGGGDENAIVTAAKNAAITAIRANLTHLVHRAAEKTVREKIFKSLPTRDSIVAGTAINIGVDVAATVAAERTRLEDLLDNGNLESVISKYPVRESAALGAIARAIGCQSQEQYESTVRVILMEDATLLAQVRTWFGSLPAALGMSTVAAAPVTEHRAA